MKRLIILGLVAALVIVMSAPAALFAAGGKKVTICHNGHTIKVSKSGWKHGHKKHGDPKHACGNGNHHGNGNGDHHGNGNGDDREDCDKNDNGILTASKIEYCHHHHGDHGDDPEDTP